eukprot:14684254-Alexandrium_andersonii.AAC.1
MQIRTSAKVVKNEPSAREQHTRGGLIASTMRYAVEQSEQEPRRELIRNKMGNSDTRKVRQTELLMERIRSSWQFR